MKRSCKNIDITNPAHIKPYVEMCIYRHYRRNDFKRLLYSYGLNKIQYQLAYNNYDKSYLNVPIESISVDLASRIKERNLNLYYKPQISERADKTTFKIRMIGKESPLQQVFDYIAVYSCEDVWRRRFVKQQCSSIKGRGQIYGVKLIKKYIQRDYRSFRYAKKHNYKYTRKCKYFVKLDAKSCYANGRLEYLMPVLKSNCANKDILWLWEELINSYKVDVKKLDGTTERYKGFMIGALPSMWGMQLMISYIYRFAMNLVYKRKDRSIRVFNHSVIYLDDILLFGSNRKKMLKYIKEIISYAKNSFGIFLKNNFSIKCIDDESVDMMGFVVHKNGKVTIRHRNFKHSRRLALRYDRTHQMTYTSAKRVNSYKGYYMHSDSQKVVTEYNMKEMFEKASKVISIHDKESKYDNTIFSKAKPNIVYAS